MHNVLAEGYTVRHATPDDAPAVHALITASDMADWGQPSGYSVAEIEDEIRDADQEHDTWIVTDTTGAVTGFATIRDRQHVRMDVEGYVHPDHQGRGIGATLVRLSEARAREHVPLAPEGVQVVLQNWINADNASARRLLQSEGYAPARYFLQMQRALGDDLERPSLRDNMTFRSCEAEGDQRRMYETIEEAMADHWGHIPRSFEQWMDRRRGSTFDPSLWWLAMDGDRPAAGAVCMISEGIGWVDLLGVRAAWRNRGLGMALLRQAAITFRQRGLDRMALDVDADSPTGATRLYERAGMHVTQRHATYFKELRPGRAFAEA